MQQDHRWLSEFPIADILITRYLTMVSPDWYTRMHPDIGTFRAQLRQVSNAVRPSDVPTMPSLQITVNHAASDGGTNETSIRVYGTEADLEALASRLRFLGECEREFRADSRKALHWMATFSVTQFQPRVQFPLPDTPKPVLSSDHER